MVNTMTEFDYAVVCGVIAFALSAMVVLFKTRPQPTRAFVRDNLLYRDMVCSRRLVTRK